MRRWPIAVILVLFLAISTPLSAEAVPARSVTGEITSLTATGASDPGDPIQISSSSEAKSSLEKTNLYYEVFDEAGTLVATRQYNADRLEAGDVVNDNWSTTNTPTTGTYTVTLCWSTGQAHNCDIDYVETSFYSVPSLGWPLTVVAVGLLSLFILRRKSDFSEALV